MCRKSISMEKVLKYRKKNCHIMNLVVVIYFNVLCCAITMSKAEYIVTFVVSVTSVNLLLRGGNNVWMPTNVRSLGCYSPFNLQSIIVNANSDGTQVGLSECFICYTNFILIRGIQCLCIEDRGIAELIRVNDTYCDIRCDDSSQPTGTNSSFMCGGNLGANLYCNKQAGSICHANSNQSVVEIYRDFDKNQGNDFELMVPCLDLGCGQPDYNDKFHLVYVEYFPNLNPEDCIIYCTYMKTSYAHVGWYPAGKKLYPECICSNATGDPYVSGPPCVKGTCPSPLNPVRFIDGYDANDQMPSCGNKDFDTPYWSIFCTMTILKEANETQCASFQTSLNNSWDTCPAPLTSTQKASSSSLTTQAPHNSNCQSRNKSTFLNSLVKLGERSSLNVGFCANYSRVYNGSCYFIESLSDNDMEDVDDWRNASAKYCNEKNNGHLLAIETEDEKNFITGEFLLAGLEEDEEYMRPYLTSGVKTNKSTEFWSLPDNVQILITDMSDWGVELLNCEEEYPSFLMLYYDLDTQGYNSWEFTRSESSRYFICEYDEPENGEITLPSSTTVSSTSTAAATFSTSTSTSPSTTTPTKITTQFSSTSSTTTKTSSIPLTSTFPTTTTISESTTSDLTPSNSSSTLSSPTMETTRITTSTTTSTLVPESNHKNCPCVETDIYHTNWTIRANTTKSQNCRPGAIGMASWSCDLNNNGCFFRTKQPNFSDCQSKELSEIANNVADYETELTVVWESLSNFTQPNDIYFGHEIEYILELIVNLLDRQDEQMNNTINQLEFQINTTYTGAHILDNLISHDIQWDQLNQVNRSQTALFFLNVSEDMSFRLSDVADMDGRSLRCEINLFNITLSSSYWNGSSNEVHDCSLKPLPVSDIFHQFPLPGQFADDLTYILLPEEAVIVGRTHKAAGLLISHYILQQLFPGQNSVIGDQKQINSPLISYSLRDDDAGERNLSENGHIPENTFVQIVYKHAQLAKDPSVRIIHRELNPGEKPSAVIGSAFCAFLSFHDSSIADEVDGMTWIWNDRGCSLISTNRTHTLCKCNHLTGFSTLMDFHEYTGESRPLEITSIVCCMASAISLAITFTVLTVLRSIKTDRTIITQNLCIFLMISHILTLTTLDRHYLKLDDVTCAIMSVSLHFSLLVSFMWMGIEGVRLCRMVIYVFNLCDWTLYYILAAYIVPFVIVGSTILVAYFTTGIIPAYVGDETCWLNGTNYKWSFAGPIAVIIIANVVFAITAVRSSWNLKQNLDRSFEEKIRNAAALSLSLTCLLGISWLTGFFLYMETQIFAYIFTITNGLQGVTIMLFRCVLNDEVSTAFKERWKRHKSNRLGNWSSTMTNNTNSQRRQSVLDSTDNNSRSNRKLAQTNSRLSTLSNATKTTDTTYVSNNSIRRPERNQRKNNIRTFSGTEFSETEYSSEARGSFSSTGSYRHNLGKQKEPAVNSGARESRRVSFFFQDNTLPSTSIPPNIPEEVHENTSVSRRFYEQDPSAFF